MRSILSILSLALFASFVLFAIHGVRPICSPYGFVHSMSSARAYWVEWEEGRSACIRHKYGSRCPVDGGEFRSSRSMDATYSGASGRLWVVHLPGVGERFLVFDSCLGAYTMRRVLYRIGAFGSLVPVADIVTVAEIQGDEEVDVLDATFEDVDGDGVEELIETERDWVTDGEGNLINNWGIRSTSYAWDGGRFRARDVRPEFRGSLTDRRP
jgi:hypothetical protein